MPYGLLVGIAGAAGVFVSGYLTDRLRRYNPRWGLWLVSASLVLAVPFQILAWHSGNLTSLLMLLFVPEFLQLYYAPPTFSAIQAVSPRHYHAMGSALFLAFATGIGISIGPLLTGLLSDHFAYLGTGSALGLALSVLTIGKLWAALHFTLAAKRLPSETLDA